VLFFGTIAAVRFFGVLVAIGQLTHRGHREEQVSHKEAQEAQKEII
jgi:hypothetical protein